MDKHSKSELYVLSGHYIDNDWTYQKKILCFCPIYSHKGKDIANLLDNCFKSWGLDDKVFTLTVDNASSNDTACVELKRLLQKKPNTFGKGIYLQMRCVAHIINLIVWDGLNKNKKSINKVRYAVKFVKSSPARLEFFKDVAKKYTKCELSLSMDVPTRWNFTYTMLETTLNYKDVFPDVNVPINPIDHELGTNSDDVDEFGNPIDYKVEHYGAPSDFDWTIIQALVTFLKEFKCLTDQVSGSLYVTSNTSFFIIARALRQLKTWNNSKDEDFKAMSTAMKKNLISIGEMLIR
ncbi:zinc finger BED domain-containing protein RICESLEEPER 2-like [Silene latifolia]|uniref:zinc finger BED domain-containing protein RICESLEEPER 2-like n=1 Tax=Silene latifolia TaxID=37657 RepID=UPI003D7744E4